MKCAACGHVAHPDAGCNTKGCDCSAEQYAPEHAVADGHVFGSPDSGVTDKPWDGSASRFNDSQYQRAAAACDPGDGTVKERCFLPHHEPDGTTNVNGVHAAAQRISSLSGHSPDTVAKAKSHLRSHYQALGEDPPDSIKAGVDEPGKAAGRRATLTQGHRTGGRLAAAKAAPDAPPDADPVTGTPYRKWHMPVSVLEGVRTGDGRKIAAEALTWRDLPQPLMALTKTTEGHDEAEVVGRVDEAKRIDAAKMIDARTGQPYGKGTYAIEMWGVFTNAEKAQEVHDLIAGRFLRGVSVDLSDVEAELEVVDKPDEEGEESEPGLIDILFGGDDMLEVLTAGRIGPVTVVPFPAFEAAYIELIDDEGNVGPSTQPGRPTASEQRRALRIHHAFNSRPCAPCTAGRALVAGGGPMYPPAAWFADPGLDQPTRLTVLDDGRLFGHAALWDVCHTGFAGQCVKAPHSQTGYALFRLGAVKTAEDGLVPVGQITMDTGHLYDMRASRSAVLRHYDNTGTAVADVAVGEDAHGIWVAGAVRPDASEAQIRALRAAKLSGDWREWGGNLEMLALLAVNSPGFPTVKQLSAGGMPRALVAAGIGPLGQREPSPADIVADAIAHLPELRLMRRARVERAREAVARARAGSARARMAGRGS